MWVANEEGLYWQARELTRAAISENTDESDEPATFDRDGAVQDLATAAENWIAEEMRPDLEPSMFSDMLTHALQGVDWHELAGDWIDSENE
jgi:hypothetical protein